MVFWLKCLPRICQTRHSRWFIDPIRIFCRQSLSSQVYSKRAQGNYLWIRSSYRLEVAPISSPNCFRFVLLLTIFIQSSLKSELLVDSWLLWLHLSWLFRLLLLLDFECLQRILLDQTWVPYKGPNEWLLGCDLLHELLLLFFLSLLLLKDAFITVTK